MCIRRIMAVYFTIASVCFKIHTSQVNKIWKKYKCTLKDVNNDFIEVIFEKNCIFSGYLNLEIWDNIAALKRIIRREDDIMITDKKWSYNVVFPLRNVENGFAFLLQLFYTHAVQRHMIQIHSSLIENNGRGLMFLGPSGIGKTTQAELWNKYRDALIINGDIVFVQETEDSFLGWGTPWHGSSPYCENTSVPVEALVVLKQAPENSIRELTGFEKVSAVSGSVFYPQWLENGMELCLETLDHLLSALPVYELSCRPDEEAVALTEKTVFGGC